MGWAHAHLDFPSLCRYTFATHPPDETRRQLASSARQSTWMCVCDGERCDDDTMKYFGLKEDMRGRREEKPRHYFWKKRKSSRSPRVSEARTGQEVAWEVCILRTPPSAPSLSIFYRASGTPYSLRVLK